MMTEPIPQKRPSASFFLNKSPEFQCYGFDLKIKDFFWNDNWAPLSSKVCSNERETISYDRPSIYGKTKSLFCLIANDD